MGFLTRRIVAVGVFVISLSIVLPMSTASAQPSWGSESSALQGEPKEIIGEGADALSPIILSTELLGRPYYRVVAVSVGSDISEVTRVLPSSLLVSTNPDFMESADEEFHRLQFTWDTSAVSMNEAGTVTLTPTMQLTDDAVWGIDPLFSEVKVVVCAPNTPTLKHQYFDGTRLIFPWKNVDDEAFAGMEVLITTDGSSWMELDGHDGFFGIANPNGLWIDAQSLKEETVYTLRLTRADGFVDFANIEIEEGMCYVEEYEGDRDSGDVPGNGPANGSQPGGSGSEDDELLVPESGGDRDGGDVSGNGPAQGDQAGDAGNGASAGGGVQESYGHDQTTISGKRANDLANRQNSVVFDFGDVTVSVPSQSVLDLHLEESSQLSATVERGDDGSVHAQVTAEEGAIDVSATVSRTSQNTPLSFATGALIVVACMAAVAALAGGVFFVVRRWGTKGVRA